MKKFMLCVTASMLLLSCSLKRGERLLTENGKVVAKQYSPDTRQTVIGTGFSSNGSMVITSHSIGENQRFNIVFQCDHNVIFTINDPMVYAKLKEGDKVKIQYYELLNKKGTVKDYEFVDANTVQ